MYFLSSKIFSLVLPFCRLNITCLGSINLLIYFWCLYLEFSELPGYVHYFSFWKVFSYFLHHYFFCSIFFSSPYGIPVIGMLLLWYQPRVLAFFKISFLFAFQIGKFLLSCHQACLVYWWIHQSHSSFLLVCLISSISFWFFLRVSISLFTLFICFCMLYTFFPLEHLIIFCLIILTSESDSDACFVSLDCVLSCLFVCLVNFLLKTRYVLLD